MAMQFKNNDFLIILVGRTFYVLLTVLSIRIMSSMLSEEEIGNYYLILAYIFFFTSGIISPFGSYITRNINLWKQNRNIQNALLVYLFYGFLISLLSLLVAYIIFDIYGYSVTLERTKIYIYIFLTIFVGNTHNAILGLANIMGYRVFYIKYLILTVLFGLLLAIAANIIFDPNALNWLFGFLLAESILIFLVVYRLNIIIKGRISFEIIKIKLSKDNILRVLLYSSPLLMVSMLSWIQNYSYRFIIEYKYGLETLAFIGLGFSIASSIMAAFESVISQYLNPIFYQTITSANKKERVEIFVKNINTALPVYLLVTLFIIGLAPHLIKILVAEKFYYSYIYLIIGACIELLRVFINHAKLIFYSEYKNNLIILPCLISSLLMLLVLSFTNLDGKLYYIVIVIFIFFILYTIIIFKNVKKIVRTNIINIKKSFLTICLGVIFLTALYFNDEKDFNLLNSVKIVAIYILVFILFIFKISNIGFIKAKDQIIK